MGFFDNKGCDDWADLEAELDIEEYEQKNGLYHWGGDKALVATQQRAKKVLDEYDSIEQRFYDEQSEKNVRKRIGCSMNERHELAKEYLDELGIDKESCKKIRLLNSEPFIDILKKLLLSEEGKLLKKDCKGIIFHTMPTKSKMVEDVYKICHEAMKLWIRNMQEHGFTYDLYVWTRRGENPRIEDAMLAEIAPYTDRNTYFLSLN